LKPPQISYHSSSKAGKNVNPKEGGWNIRDRKFIRSGNTLRYWVVVAFIEQRRQDQARQFVQDLVNISRQQGVVINNKFHSVINCSY